MYFVSCMRSCFRLEGFDFIQGLLLKILSPSLVLSFQNPEKCLLKKDNCPVIIQMK